MSKQQKAFNIDPYYDDFDENKNFHQIMFKAGTSVQGRELTQLQTIIRDQIKKFGDHVFQQGSIVIPGNSFVDTTGVSIKLEDGFSGTSIDVSLFADKVIVGADTGVEAIVRAAIPSVLTDPNTIIVNFIRAGDNGEAQFNDSEEIYLKENISVRALLSTDPYADSAMAFINDGVYYINGNFVKVLKQSVVLEKYSKEPNCHVLLQIFESLVTSDDDQSLLDPAQGEPNYAAPGADRLKIELKLVTLPLGSVIGDDFVEIMRFEDGTLVYHSRNPKYSELEKSLARRTYDESGDYVVTGFVPSILEHLKQPKTKGQYPEPAGNKNKFVIKLTPGKAYIKGFEKETIATTVLSADKARTPEHIKYKESSVTPAFGQTIYITNMVKMPNLGAHEAVTFYNSSNPGEGSAVAVGTAKTYAIEYKEGQNIYSLYVYDVVFNGSYRYEDVGGIRFPGTGSATVVQKLVTPNADKPFLPSEIITSNGVARSATVAYHDITTSTLYAYKHTAAVVMPKIGDTIVGGTSTAVASIKEKITVETKGTQSAPIVPIRLSPLYTIRNSDGDPKIVYRSLKYLTITTDNTGAGSVNIDNGRLDSINPSSLIAVWAGGLVSLNLFSMSANGVTLSITGGPINTTINIQASVTKTNFTEKTKTLITNVETGVSLVGTSVKSHTLAKADIYELVSVVSSVDGNVTERFVLDNGQRNYTYDMGRIVLNGVAPAGTLTVTYKYFEHSTSGDFFSVDSYRNSGIADSSALDFLSYIPTFYSKTDTKYYLLGACLDFRKIIGTGGDAAINGAAIVSDFGYYVGRIDMYGISVSGSITYIQGIPEEIPELPKAPDDMMILGTLNVPAWTPEINTLIIKEEKIRRFTMKDINRLSQRVGNLENYVTMTMLESDASNMEIIDPVTGLNRYKMGLLVDDFRSATVISDYYNVKFAAEYETGTLKPPKEWVQTEMYLNQATSSNYRVTGDMITLPYTERVIISQPFSTKITNVNPFLVIAWVGHMTLDPSVDSWIETEDLPDIINTRREEVFVLPSMPPPPPVTRIGVVQPPPAPPPSVGFPPPPPPTPVPAPAPTPTPVPSVLVSAPTPAPAPPPLGSWDTWSDQATWDPSNNFNRVERINNGGSSNNQDRFA